MPWSKTSPTEERIRFVALAGEGLFSHTELCQRFGISRQTGYQWLGRGEKDGLERLQEQSCALRTCRSRVDEAVVAALLEARQLHLTLGRPQTPADVPVASTRGARGRGRFIESIWFYGVLVRRPDERVGRLTI